MSSAPIVVVCYDENWPQIYEQERRTILEQVGEQFVELEHVGSTAIPGLAAKPVIDMMAAVRTLEDGPAILARLAPLGFTSVSIDMPRRLLLRRQDPDLGCAFHLHIVEAATWPERNERLLRDYLRAHRDLAVEYGLLKRQLATEHGSDLQAYTSAKTAFIQAVVDRARDATGLPRMDVWET